MDKPSVLIVDDEPRLLESSSLLLKDDFNVITATNGRDGLSSFKNNPSISAILLDLDMPVMNGVEALERIREISSEVKVIIMTGRSCHEYARRCADLNVQGYMEKPVEPGVLINRIKELLCIDDYPVLRNYWKEKYEAKVASTTHTVKKALAYIHDNVHRDITREDVSEYLDITPDHLCRLLKKECGLAIADYINRCKILKSQEYLLSTPNKTINQVSEKVGITDANYFSRLFKKHTSLTPSEFQRNNSSI